MCLRTDQICNNVNDCGDNSDEEECGERKISNIYLHQANPCVEIQLKLQSVY